MPHTFFFFCKSILTTKTALIIVRRSCATFTHLASRAKAMIPAARGAEADVPVWESVHFCLRSVVTLETGEEKEVERNTDRSTVNDTWSFPLQQEWGWWKKDECFRQGRAKDDGRRGRRMIMQVQSQVCGSLPKGHSRDSECQPSQHSQVVRWWDEVC